MESIVNFSNPLVIKFISGIPRGVSVATSQKSMLLKDSSTREKMKAFNKDITEELISDGSLILDKSSEYSLLISNSDDLRLEDIPPSVQTHAVNATINTLGDDAEKIKKCVSYVEDIVKSARFLDENAFRNSILKHQGNNIGNVCFLVLRLKKCIADGDLEDVFSTRWMFKKKKKRESSIRIKEKIEF